VLSQKNKRISLKNILKKKKKKKKKKKERSAGTQLSHTFFRLVS
jgi:hypothetical protein